MAQSFASPEEEIQFWKDKAAVLEKEAKEIKEEFQEFQEGSRELELELETQLEQSEAKIKEFRSLTNRLQHENEQLKDKLEQCHKEYHFQVMLGNLSWTWWTLKLLSDLWLSSSTQTKKLSKEALNNLVLKML